jgi:non-specific serine/threonine protein kinase
VLATSRATLHVYGEHRWQVPPLATRVPASSSSPDQEMKIPAVELFAERAAAADRTFALTDENASTVAELCCRLEGLPLAIELAAARIAMLSPAALLKRMEPRLPVLIGGQHGQPERFRTMRQAIAWSYDLLSPADQALLRRLALFVGGFTVEAAEAVSIPLETTAGVAAEALFDSLSRLTDQSLLQRESIGEDVRFSMLEVVREFGLDALASCGELEPAKRRHAAYSLELGRALAPGLSGFEMVRNLARLEVDLPNIRAALSWALDRRQVETALRLAAELYPFWNYRGHLTEGRSWLAAALEQRGSQPQTRIDGLLAASGLAALQGDYASARSHCREAASLASQQSYPFGIARALLLQGIITEWQGDYREAAAIYAECNHHIAELGEHQWRSRLLALQAEVDAILGQTALAEQRARSALREAEGEGHAWNAGIATGVLAYLSLKRGETEEATRLYWENLSRYQDLGDHRGIGGAIAGFAGIALQIGRKQEAVRLLGAACAIGDEIGVAHLGNKGLVERLDAMARAGMQPAAYKTAWDAGHALGREWALAKAESIAGEVLKRHDAPLPDPLEGSGLTRREGEVLYLLARRLTDKEIAGALSISPRTAMNHVAHVIAKLGLANRRDVARWAREHGLA